MIAVITYDNPHRKTQDLVFQLLARGYKDLTLLAMPWIQRKNYIPLIKHRPSKAIQVSLDKFSERLGIQLIRVNQGQIVEILRDQKVDQVLIGGAGILPETLAKEFNVINGHPGYLPKVKGLDALKWAILNEDPVGVTTHFISPEADEGRLIERKGVPIFFEDTFHSFAFRQYEIEIEMLVDAIEKSGNLAGYKDLSSPEIPANRRMPHHLEIKMMDAFEYMRRNAPSIKEIQS